MRELRIPTKHRFVPFVEILLLVFLAHVGSVHGEDPAPLSPREVESGSIVARSD